MASRVQQALASVASEGENDNRETKEDRGGTKTEVDPSLRGIPESLLDRVGLSIGYVH